MDVLRQIEGSDEEAHRPLMRSVSCRRQLDQKRFDALERSICSNFLQYFHLIGAPALVQLFVQSKPLCKLLTARARVPVFPLSSNALCAAWSRLPRPLAFAWLLSSGKTDQTQLTENHAV